MSGSASNDSKPDKILPFLYLGGRNEAKSASLLQELNIKYILNCTPSKTNDKNTGCQNFFEKERLFTYHRIPIFDNRCSDISSYFESAFRFIEEGKYYGSVLVHCHKGVSRSSSFVIAYLMKYNEMTLDEALTYVKSIRSIVNPNESFLEQLRQYEVSLNHNCRNSSVVTSDDLTKAKDFAIGPSIGPSVSADIGPAIGPQFDSSVSIAIGPSMGPLSGSDIKPSIESVQVDSSLVESTVFSTIDSTTNNNDNNNNNNSDESALKKAKIEEI